MPRPRPPQLIVDSSPESQSPFIVASPGGLSQVSSGLTSIDQRMGSLDEDASSRVNDHADARFGAKMRRYGSAPAFAGLFPQPQRYGGQTFLAPKRNELERIREYFRTITDAALDSLPEIYNILQSIGQAHPFVAGALVVFETVMRLVKYKRRNDAMADALIVDMVETIKSLTVLKYLPPPNAGEVVSRTKLGRVVELVNAIHEAIKACGNACDTYYKLKGLGCFLQSSKWLEEFDAYRNRLTSLREHLHLALTIHFGLELTTRDDPQLQDNTRLLKDLCEKIDAFSSTRRQTSVDSSVVPVPIIAMAGFSRMGASAEGGAIEYDDSDPSSHIEQNHRSFEGRYTLLRRYTEDEGLTRTLLHFEVAGDSSHMIQDKDVREVWRQMGWKGNVKARHFVFALRDHFRDKIAQPKWSRLLSESSLDSVDSSQSDKVDRDEWALEYLNVSHLQPIMEAFDDDASGFITLTEVDNMYMSLPSNWSLPKWLAYWAAGWQVGMSSYASKIDDILSEMFNLKSQVLLCNRTCIEEYLAGVWSPITELTSSFRRRDDELLSEKFNDYTEAELSRLRNNLECIQYRVDLDNLEGVTGGGRIEKSAFPLLYLLLERDYNIMKLCLTDVIHMGELYDSRKAICSVVAAIDVRCDDLVDLFRQQKLDPEQQLKIFACQLFDNRHHRGSFWSIDNLRFRTFGEQLNRQHELGTPPKENLPVATLNYPTLNAEYWFSYPSNEPELVMNDTGADPLNAGALEALLGRWSGFITRTDGQSYSHAMVMLDVQLSDDHQSVHASGESARGIPWTFSGQVRECIHEYPSDSHYPFFFRITYGSHHPPQLLHGQLGDGGSTLSGVWGFPGKDEKSFRFYFKKTDPTIMRFRPFPADFARNRSRALWRFAIDATVGSICRTQFTLAYLRERQAIRRRYVALLSRIETGAKLTAEERDEMSECFRRMTASEARFSNMVYDMQKRSKVIHYGVECMNCKVHNTQFVGARLVCLTCTAAGHVVDLCEKPQCASATINSQLDHHHHPHHPHHDMLKLRRCVHVHREFGKVFRDAQTGLAHGRNILSDATPAQGHISPTDKLFQAVISPAPFAMGRRSSRVAVTESACVKCEMVISQPCWYCVDCKGEVFVCTSCDHKYGGVQVAGSEHRADHSLVMCQRPASREVHLRSGGSEQTLGTDRRLKTLEKKLESLERKMDRLSGLLLDRFDRLEGVMRVPVAPRSGPALS